MRRPMPEPNRFRPLILAQRALVAIEVGNWNAAASHSQQARTLIDEHSLHEYWTSALVFALAARVALHRGDVLAGRDNAAPRRDCVRS